MSVHGLGDAGATQALLANGTMPDRPARTLPGGINGRLGVYEIAGHGAAVPAVIKTVPQGGAHEVFAYEVAKAMRMEHLLPATGRRSNGDAAIEFRPGADFESQGLRSSAALERELARGYERARGMAPTAAAKQAHIDRQLLQAFDLVIGNRDRHGRNGLWDARTGTLTLIDHGKMASFKREFVQYNSDFSRGEGVRLLEPRWGGRVGRDLAELELDPDVRAILARTDRAHIEQALKQLRHDLPRVGAIGDNGVRPDRTWLPRMFAALDSFVDRGTLRFVASAAL